ncbi:MAG: hypothetical protein LUG86_05235 [Oscillospiraceae bacterium]|nr:hypothetical protein [Oscillospiraceae bacterium]
MLKNKKIRTLFCLLTALGVLFAFSGCGDSSKTNSDTTTSSSGSSETVESGTKSGASDITLGLGDGDTYISREDYTLLGDYYYFESYRIETEDGVLTELGLDMYLNYDEENSYTDADGVLAIYYEDGVMTGYEAYVGINPIRQTVSYQVATDSTYYTCICLDSDGNITEVVWENYVYNSETGVTTYYTGSETYYESAATERSYQEEYTVSDDGILTLSKTTTKEYDEDGNVTTNETVEY